MTFICDSCVSLNFPPVILMSVDGGNASSGGGRHDGGGTERRCKAGSCTRPASLAAPKPHF